jgi:hypothetical protein
LKNLLLTILITILIMPGGTAQGQKRGYGFVGAYRVEMDNATDRSNLFLDLPNKVWTYARNNYDASREPLATDDVDSGYRRGVSKWFFGGSMYLLKDETTSGAVWERSNLELEDLAGVAVSGSTSDLAEGTNLFYTDERVDDRVATIIQDGTGISWDYIDAANPATLTPTVSLAPFTTDNLAEGSNLYFTNARVASYLLGVDTIAFTDVQGTIAGIQNQNLLDKTANEVITGDWIFDGISSIGAEVLGSGGSLLVRGQGQSPSGLIIAHQAVAASFVRMAIADTNTFNFYYTNDGFTTSDVSHRINLSTGEVVIKQGLAFEDATVEVAGIQNQNLLDKTANESISGAWTFASNISFDNTSRTIAGIQNQNLLDKTANETITGDWAFQGSTFTVDSQISTADAVLVMNDGEAGAGVTLGYSGHYIDRGSANPYWMGFDEVRNTFTIGELTALNSTQIATTQAIATREDSPTINGIAVWSNTDNRFNTTVDLILNSISAANVDIASLSDLISSNSNGFYAPTGQQVGVSVEGATPMVWHASGVTQFGGNVTFTSASQSIAGIENQNLLSKVSSETITGAWEFSGAATFADIILTKSSTDPLLTIKIESTDATYPSDFRIESYRNTLNISDYSGTAYPMLRFNKTSGDATFSGDVTLGDATTSPTTLILETNSTTSSFAEIGFEHGGVRQWEIESFPDAHASFGGLFAIRDATSSTRVFTLDNTGDATFSSTVAATRSLLSDRAIITSIEPLITFVETDVPQEWSMRSRIGDFVIRDDTGTSDRFAIAVTTGYVNMPGVYAETTASAGNVFVASDGSLRRSTSSKAFKNITGRIDISDEVYLNWEAVEFISTLDNKKYFGYTAEQTEEIGLTPLVDYDSKGKPVGIHYAHATSVNTAKIQELINRISKLENQKNQNGKIS